MRTSLPTIVAAVGAMSLSLPAYAQSRSDCPPGSWFCEEAEVPTSPPAKAAPRAAQPPPDAEDTDPTPEPAAPARRSRYQPPPVVVYQPVPASPPPEVIVITPEYAQRAQPVRRVPPPPPSRRVRPRWHSEWGLNLRVEGIALGRNRHTEGGGSPGMGGVGMSLRYRPVPAFSFDLGVDVLAGNDYNGFTRTEVPITLGGLIYLNPRSRVQVYLEGGAHFSFAKVRNDELFDWSSHGTHYTYFGGQGGGGLEFRLSRHIALNVGVLGFVRQRIDDGKVPEFIDERTGRSSNASGGALFRGGLTFWW